MWALHVAQSKTSGACMIDRPAQALLLFCLYVLLKSVCRVTKVVILYL